MEDKRLIKFLIKEIKKNKKYKTIAEEVILREIKEYFKKNPDATEDKSTIKEIRAQLHKSYSSFQTKKKNKREKYLEELDTDKLLSITLSTKERLDDYKKLYQNIFKITGKPKTIIDIGCGLNPVSYPLMSLKKLTYLVYDIDEEDIKFLNKYFKIMKSKGLNGKAEILDVRNNKKIFSLPSSDIILLFKVLDLIDKENHKPSEELIKILIKKTDFIIASFATKTITRKQMKYPKRKWFELMLERLNLKFKIIETSNEIYYVVSK